MWRPMDISAYLYLEIIGASQLLSKKNAFQFPLQKLSSKDRELTCVLVQVPNWVCQHQLLLHYCFLQNNTSLFPSFSHLGQPALGGIWTRLPPEISSNLNQCVILCFCDLSLLRIPKLLCVCERSFLKV